MKKILHMTPPDINNGIYRYVFNHLKYIDHSKYQFEFLTRNEAGLKLTKEYKEFGFGIRAFTNVEREGKEGLRKEIVRILEKGYDAIHLHTSTWRGLLIEEIAMEMEVPKVIVHSHSTGIDCMQDEERDYQYKIHEDYKRRFDGSYATDFCACSKLAGDWLFGTHIPREQIRILPNAIELDRYRYSERMRHEVRVKLGIEDRIVVGNVGRYSYQKNQELLIRAFAKASCVNKELFLLLIGEGELKGYFEKLITELGISERVLCMEWQRNVEDYLQAMDVFCLPSRFEGLPISAIEAQAAGLPCFISDTVADEVKVTELVKFLPLREEKWVSVLTRMTVQIDRRARHEEMTRNGYNIKESVKQLESLY